MRKALLFTLAFIVLVSYTPIASAAKLPVPISQRALAEDPDPAMVRAAVEALKNMPRKERKEKLKAAKKELKAFKAAKKRGEEVDTNLVLMVILAIFLPPVAAYLNDGAATTRFWITLLLFLLGVAGAFIFGWWAVLAAIILALIIVLGGA